MDTMPSVVGEKKKAKCLCCSKRRRRTLSEEDKQELLTCWAANFYSGLVLLANILTNLTDQD